MCFAVNVGVAGTEAGAAGREAGFAACRLVHQYMQAIATRHTAISPIIGPIAIGVLFFPGSGFLRLRMRVGIMLCPCFHHARGGKRDAKPSHLQPDGALVYS
jgi:hypothetical protein